MNIVFSTYLDTFVLVFIDDNLVYSKAEEERKKHLKLVLKTLREHQFYAKFNECEFYKNIIQYLGHIISKDGLAVDLEKVRAMVMWPIPKDVFIVQTIISQDITVD